MIHITQEAIIQKKCRYCSDFPLHWVCESQACGVGAHGLEGRLPHHGGLKGEGERGELSWGKHWCIGEPLFNGPIKHCHTTFYAATLCYAEADQILSFWILTWSGDLNTWKCSIKLYSFRRDWMGWFSDQKKPPGNIVFVVLSVLSLLMTRR